MTRDVAIGTSRGIEVQNDTATETYVVAPRRRSGHPYSS